jgi:hypothetical protein
VPRRVDLAGQRFGRLVVMGTARDIRRRLHWECRCDCGAVVMIAGQSLRYGRSSSCGCLRGEQLAARNTVHGQTDTRAHRAWRNMLQRCQNPRSSHWASYGGRGIRVCDAWLDFGAFLRDMGHPPHGTSLDRIDVDGPYEPENCRWATTAAQARNRRNTIMLTARGVTLNLQDWATQTGIPYGTLYARHMSGKSADEVLGGA